MGGARERESTGVAGEEFVLRGIVVVVKQSRR
jgi:hypothetical protein